MNLALRKTLYSERLPLVSRQFGSRTVPSIKLKLGLHS